MEKRWHQNRQITNINQNDMMEKEYNIQSVQQKLFLSLYKIISKMPQQVYPEDYSCIIDPKEGCGGLYIGNLEAAQNIATLRKLQVKAVLTAAKGVELSHPKTQVPYFLYVPADDHQSFQIAKYFHQAASFISDCVQRTNIMVHCLAGVSRSVSLVLAFLIKHQGFSYNQAFDFVKSRRKIIHPNDGFIQQLKKFQGTVESTTQKSMSTSPTKNFTQRQNSLSTSPSKKYTSNKEIQAILLKYQNYKNMAALSYTKRNPETPLQLKKTQSYAPEGSFSPQKNKFRGKRVSSMNVERNDLFDSGIESREYGTIKRCVRKDSYNPLESIQNTPMQLSSGTAEIDKKIQQIRRKYQQYQTPSVTSYKYTPSFNADQNINRTPSTTNSGYERQYLRYTQQRRQSFGGEANTGSNRLRRLTSFQQY